MAPFRLLLFLLFCSAPVFARAQKQPPAQQFADLGTCKLESGQTIQQCRLGYRTFGRLNPDHSNAVLMPTWLYGKSSELTSLFGETATPTRLVDTSLYFGIAIDSFGNGVSSSPSNSTQQHGTAFPSFTTHDMVEAEFRLATEVLHLQHAHAVLGLSMGGEQTFMWAVLHPTFFDLAIPILGTPRLTAFDLQTKRIMLDAIRSDPGYHDGNYTRQPALRLANLYNVQMVTTPDFRNTTTSTEAFEQFVQTSEAPVPMDANDRVWQLRAVTTHDVLRGRPIEQVAIAPGPRFLIIVNSNDRMVTPAPALAWADLAHADRYISHGNCGHLIMTCDAPAVSGKVQRFLAQTGPR